MSKPDSNMPAIANRLRLAREQAGLSQGQVAKQLGMHRPTISEIEAGRRRVSADELAAFARLYDVSTTWLVDEQSEISDADQDRIQLAARKLAHLKPEDLDRLLDVIKTLRTQEDNS
jgi:transcriptional regulator with XRE-family HTH domain